MHAARRVGAASDDDGVFVARLAGGLHDVALHDDIGQRRIIGLLAGVELEWGTLIAPDPAGMAMTEIGNDVVGDD